MTLTAFLNKNCKPLMKWYYMKRYRKEIYEALKFFMQAPMTFNEYMNVAPYVFGWDLKKCALVFGYLYYCGLIGKPE